jgi:hypothetical protein
VLRDTTFVEMGSWSARATGDGGATTGLFYLEADDLIARFGASGGNIVVAARVWAHGSSGNPGRLFCSHTGNTVELASSSTVSTEKTGGWTWTFLIIPESFYGGNSDFWLGVYTGGTSERVSVDRVIIGNSIVLPDSDETSTWCKRFEVTDSAHSVLDGAVALRTFGVAPVEAVKGCSVKVRTSEMVSGVILHAQATATDQVQIILDNRSGGTVNVPINTIYAVEVGI